MKDLVFRSVKKKMARKSCSALTLSPMLPTQQKIIQYCLRVETYMSPNGSLAAEECIAADTNTILLLWFGFDLSEIQKNSAD